MESKSESGDNSSELIPPNEEIVTECKPFILSNIHLNEIMKNLAKDINNGLKKDSSSVVKCFITYIHQLPNGSEKGDFLALDLGGTNFRVLLVKLGPNIGEFHQESEIFKIPLELQTGNGHDLFDHIAKCLAEFIGKHREYIMRLGPDTILPLGFTFSFPLKQKGLTKGYLVEWTKGFTCSNVVNKDVVLLLKNAINRREDFNIDVVGILNDTTGTIMSCAWKNPNTKIGLIIGTGCNACYIEKIENVENFDRDKSTESEVIINTEWGAFGDDGSLDSILTKYDREVNENSANPGKQTYEKMISGMYMGEIARLTIVDLASKNMLFNGMLTERMKEKDSLVTSDVSEIESDKTKYGHTRKILKKLGITDPTLEDCANVQYICACVSKRAAHLVSAGLATLINKINEKDVTIGVDGSVYKLHPNFRSILIRKMKELTNSNINFELMVSEDGSGRGAALVAAVAARLSDDALQNKEEE